MYGVVYSSASTMARIGGKSEGMGEYGRLQVEDIRQGERRNGRSEETENGHRRLLGIQVSFFLIYNSTNRNICTIWKPM